MGLIVSEVYEALMEAGATEEKARAAAGALPLVERLATREDFLRLEKTTTRLETQMATREDFLRLEKTTTRLETRMATREDFLRLEKAITRLETNMATKADIARIDKRVAVLNLAVFGFHPAILAFLVKLIFFS